MTVDPPYVQRVGGSRRRSHRQYALPARVSSRGIGIESRRRVQRRTARPRRRVAVHRAPGAVRAPRCRRGIRARPGRRPRPRRGFLAARSAAGFCSTARQPLTVGWLALRPASQRGVSSRKILKVPEVGAVQAQRSGIVHCQRIAPSELRSARRAHLRPDRRDNKQLGWAGLSLHGVIPPWCSQSAGRSRITRDWTHQRVRGPDLAVRGDRRRGAFAAALRCRAVAVSEGVRVQPGLAPIASTRPRWASLVTRATPVRPRATRSRKKASQPVLGRNDVQAQITARPSNRAGRYFVVRSSLCSLFEICGRTSNKITRWPSLSSRRHAQHQELTHPVSGRN
jgi:hypothetical protein